MKVFQFAAVLMLTAFHGAASAGGAASTEKALRAAVAGAHRSEANIARNAYRHPVETLLFFGLRDNMTVVEVLPGGGWYTEVLAPVLRSRGTLYAASYDQSSTEEYYKVNSKKYLDKLAAAPAIYDKVKVTELAPPAKTVIAPAGSADLVLTFRNVHNWVEAGTEDAIFKAMYTALKPGGILGVVEHRANPDMVGKKWAEKGYVAESEVIRMAATAGFKLLARSEINANPKDTKDYPKGVWTLPPSFAEGDTDRAKYAAIGESDRMTLKFQKPR